MSLKRSLALLVALGAAAAGVGSSGATFTSSSSGGGNAISAARDWTPPTVALANPGSPLSGTVTLTATASDAISGVASVALQVAPNGSNAFTTICTDTSAPYTCAWSTTALATGRYDLRALATDVDGNSATSALIDARWVDNTTPSVTASAPAGPLHDTVTIGATSTTASGMGSVVLQRAPTGTTTWTTICTGTQVNASCAWDTTAVADGTYDLRAVLTTASGKTATSTTLTGRRVDNTDPTGVDVQAANRSGGTAGRLESGDQLVLTYSEAMTPASLVSGWSGTGTTPVVVSVSTATPEVLSFLAAAGGGTPALGTVTLSGNYVSALSASAVTFNATVALSANGTTVTVTLGTMTGGTLPVLGTSAAGVLRWTPGAGALDLAGNPAVTTAVAESGASDVDF